MKKKYPQPVNIKDLIFVSIYSVLNKSKKCNFNKLIKECFSSFPEAFSFSDIPEWPDSRKLDRPLRGLKENKMIKGEVQDSFKLTKKGEKRAKEVSEYLRQMRLKI